MINVAIVGAGFMGITHLNAYKSMDNVRVCAVCNTGEEKGRALAQQAGCLWYGSMETMLTGCGDEIDAVDICLPTYLHKENAILAMDAGKHVFCEKPAALTSEDFCRMNEAAARNGVRLNIGHVIRYWPEYAYARDMLQRGEFGQIKYARASRMCCVSKRAREGGWFTRPERSGGGLLDLHIHDVDYLSSVFGRVKSVYAVGSQNSEGSWSHICSSLNFESGFSAVAEGINEMPTGFPFTMELNIVGENKALCYRMGAGENLYDVKSAVRSTRVYDNAASPVAVCTGSEDAYYLELKDFVDHLEQGAPVTVVTPGDVEHTMRIMEAIRISLETGRETEV